MMYLINGCGHRHHRCRHAQTRTGQLISLFEQFNRENIFSILLIFEKILSKNKKCAPPKRPCACVRQITNETVDGITTQPGQIVICFLTGRLNLLVVAIVSAINVSIWIGLSNSLQNDGYYVDKNSIRCKMKVNFDKKLKNVKLQKKTKTTVHRDFRFAFLFAAAPVWRSRSSSNGSQSHVGMLSCVASYPSLLLIKETMADPVGKRTVFRVVVINNSTRRCSFIWE